MKKLITILKLDQIQYFDISGNYLFSLEIAGGVGLIFIGIILNTIFFISTYPISEFTYKWYSYILPFGVFSIIPIMWWVIGFFISWIKILINNGNRKR